MSKYDTLVLDDEQKAKLLRVIATTMKLATDVLNNDVDEPLDTEVDVAALYDDTRTLAEELGLVS